MILRSLQALLQTYLDAKAREADRWRECLLQISASEERRWSAFLEMDKRRNETREVGGLPPDLAIARQRLEERRLSMEEERHRLAIDIEKQKRQAALEAQQAAATHRRAWENGEVPGPILPNKAPSMFFNPERD